MCLTATSFFSHNSNNFTLRHSSQTGGLRSNSAYDRVFTQLTQCRKVFSKTWFSCHNLKLGRFHTKRPDFWPGLRNRKTWPVLSRGDNRCYAEWLPWRWGLCSSAFQSLRHPCHLAARKPNASCHLSPNLHPFVRYSGMFLMPGPALLAHVVCLTFMDI